MKHPLAPVTGCYVLGLLTAVLWQPELVVLFALALGIGILATVLSSARGWLLGFLLFLAGWLNLSWREAIISPHDIRAKVGDRFMYVRVRGNLLQTPTVVSPESNRLAWSRAPLDLVAMKFEGGIWQPACGIVMLRVTGRLPYYRGQLMEVTGVLGPPPMRSAEGLYDRQNHLNAHGIHYELRAGEEAEWDAIRLRGIRSQPWSERFNVWSRRTLARGLADEDDALCLWWAMTLGWKSNLKPETTEPFRHAGTMHVFAISGLHITLLGLILANLFRVLRLSRGTSGLVVVPLLWFYAAATGWQASATRATLMTSIVLLGWAGKRPGNLLNSLFGSAFLLLLWDPRQLFQVGFQLTFGVVFSIALVLPTLDRLRLKYLSPDPLIPLESRSLSQRWFATALSGITMTFAVSLSAWLGSLPLIALRFHLMTPIGLVANLPLIPFCGLAISSALGSLLCGDWLPSLGVLFNHSGWFWLKCLITWSEWAAGLPGAYWWVSTPSPDRLVAYYALLLAVFSADLFSRRQRVFLVAVAGGCLLWAATNWVLNLDRLQLTVLPLRGGDAIWVDMPGRARDGLIDTGTDTTAKHLVLPYLETRGLDRLQNLLLTHGDRRHVEGALRLAQAMPIECLMTGPHSFRSRVYRDICREVKGRARSWRPVQAGDRWGDWMVLMPGPVKSHARADDEVVVLWGCFHGVGVLLCSDLGRYGQQSLISAYPDLRADIVIAGIPSQEEPLGTALLDHLRPRVLIISGGDMPPGERVTQALRIRLARRSIPIFITGEEGAVSIRISRAGSRITTVWGNRSWSAAPAE